MNTTTPYMVRVHGGRTRDDHAEVYGPFEDSTAAREWAEKQAEGAPQSVSFDVMALRTPGEWRGYWGPRQPRTIRGRFSA